MKKKLLVVGRNGSIVERVLEKLINTGYDAIGTAENTVVAELCIQHQPDIVVIGGGVELNERISLKEKLREIKPGILFVEHFGSFQSLLDEITWALD